jgi:immune inhibitor A
LKVKLYSFLLPLMLVASTLTGFGYQGTVAATPPAPAQETIPQTQLPWRDLADLAVRLKGVPPDEVNKVSPQDVPEKQVGDRASFWIADQANDRYYSVDATLKVVTPHAYMYVADDSMLDIPRLQEAAQGFEDRVYSVDRHYFGSEPAVGLDGDAHVSILHATIPGLGGYFTSVDDYPRAVQGYSNERKSIYINIQVAPPGSLGYYAILAHEFEHMIHWNTNREEQTWVKEGAAEEATEATNLGGGSSVRAFETASDTQLNAWADSRGDVAPHYGAAYLFLSYFIEHYGGYEGAADLLTGTTRGPGTFDRYLGTHGYTQSFEDVFKDWVVTNYLGTRSVDPRYRYGKAKVRVPATDRVTAATPETQKSVHQFAADYIDLGGRFSSATLHFKGDRSNRLISANAASGSGFWWSNRGDLVDTKLTRSFDLTGVSGATLNFSTWYDLEDGYDYGYVMVSQDGGTSWKTLSSPDTTSDDPNGNNLGQGFTGRSRGADSGRWVQQSMDLTPYAGKEVMVRFEQVTDDAYNAPGFALDDISVPEIGYSSGAELDDGGWIAEGFIRTDGKLPQPFSLQLIQLNGNNLSVDQIPVSEDGTADVMVRNPDGNLDKAVVVISGLSRYTTEVANYRYSVEMTR